MREQIILWSVLLAVNLCIVIVYLILCHMKQKEDKLSVWMKAAVMLCLRHRESVLMTTSK